MARTRFKFALILFALVIIASCTSSGPVCNEPYLAVGDSCCLDKDANAVCDKDEQAQVVCEDVPVDCSLCAPTIVTETEVEEKIRILCQDGETIADSAEECQQLIDPKPEYTPITTNEDDQRVLQQFTLRPACRSGFNAVEVHFALGSTAKEIQFQAKSSEDGEFEELFSTTSTITEDYLYGVFCEGSCTSNADFFLDPDGVYLFRGEFDYLETSWETIIHSNEHVIDVTEDGKYMAKLC